MYAYVYINLYLDIFEYILYTCTYVSLSITRYLQIYMKISLRICIYIYVFIYLCICELLILGWRRCPVLGKYISYHTPSIYGVLVMIYSSNPPQCRYIRI